MRIRTSLVAVVATSLIALAGCSQRSDESTAHAQQPGGDSTYDANGTAAGTDMNATGTAYGSTTPTANPEEGAVPADNTGVNKRDRNDANPTADDQSQDAADLDLVKRIRQSIEADDSLSTNGKNVKVVTNGGMVTLRGPVKSEQERKSIEDKATMIAGTGKVHNLLEVTP